MRKYGRIVLIATLLVLLVLLVGCPSPEPPIVTKTPYSEPPQTESPTPEPPPTELPPIEDDPLFDVGDEKPVIYLYPTEPTYVTVFLQYDGELTFTYPEYNGGWSVTAYPDGTLINHNDGREYSYLFWEGFSKASYDFSRGFVVKGEDSIGFLQEKLSYMGLLPREYNEFITYWGPKMQDNEYNLITFQGEAYTDIAQLIITPAPDCMLRIFMAFKPLDEPVEIEEQVLATFDRNGFTVIEWGGCIIQ